MQAGATLWRSDDGLKNAGLFGGAGDAKMKARSLATGFATSSRLDGWHVGAYWTSLSNWEGDGSGPYADLWAYWAQFRNKLSAAKWSMSGWAASAEFGWSAKPNGAPFAIEPHIQAVWSRLRSKDFEREGEAFTGGRFSGLSTRAGVRIFGDPERSAETGRKLAPMLEVNWLRDAGKIRTRVGKNGFSDGGSGNARNVAEVKAGWQGSISQLWESWGHFGWQRGGGHYRNTEFQIGVSRSF